MPPQVNALVTAVRGQGEPDDWDTNEGGDAGAAKWAGELRAYYREKADRVVDGGAVKIITRRTLWVDTPELRRALAAGDRPLLEALDTDDVITFTSRGRELELSAIAIAPSELAGLGAVQTTRIDLEHGNA